MRPDNGRDEGRPDGAADRRLERELRDLGSYLEYPPTPDLSRSVLRQLDEEAERTGPPATRRAALIPLGRLVAAAVLVLAVAIPVLSPGARSAIGELVFVGAGAGGAQSVAEGGSAEDGAAGAGGGASAVSSEQAMQEEAGTAGGPGGEASQMLSAGGQAAGASSTEATMAGSSGGEGAPASGGTASSQAACASPAPTLSARPARVGPGEAFELRGELFIKITACPDTSPSAEAAARDAPVRNIRVTFRQDGRTRDLGTVDSGADGRFRQSFRVPEDARAGRAIVRASAGAGATGAAGGLSAEARLAVPGGG